MVLNHEQDAPPVRTHINKVYYKLSLAIHLFVVGLIVARGDILKPVFIIEIPLYCFLDALFKLERWFPAEFCLQFARVNSITGIVAKAVSNVCDEVEVFAFLASKEPINGIDDYLDDVDVLPLVEATDVIGFSYFALMEDEVDGTSVVFYKEPVAHVLALAIDRQWLAVADIVDKERNQFLRELIRAVVV